MTSWNEAREQLEIKNVGLLIGFVNDGLLRARDESDRPFDGGDVAWLGNILDGLRERDLTIASTPSAHPDDG